MRQRLSRRIVAASLLVVVGGQSGLLGPANASPCATGGSSPCRRVAAVLAVGTTPLLFVVIVVVAVVLALHRRPLVLVRLLLREELQQVVDVQLAELVERACANGKEIERASSGM
jgi:hypothetical protein